MKFLEFMRVGDRFRPAHPRQPSMNNRTMSRDFVYELTKVFPQEPCLRIAVSAEFPNAGFYSLPPKALVILPTEAYPTEEDIVRFLVPWEPVKRRRERKIYGVIPIYRANLPKIGGPPNYQIDILHKRGVTSLMAIIRAMGRETFDEEELEDFTNKNWKKIAPSSKSPVSILWSKHHLINCGFLLPVPPPTDDDPDLVPDEIRDANLVKPYQEFIDVGRTRNNTNGSGSAPEDPRGIRGDGGKHALDTGVQGADARLHPANGEAKDTRQ